MADTEAMRTRFSSYSQDPSLCRARGRWQRRVDVMSSDTTAVLVSWSMTNVFNVGMAGSRALAANLGARCRIRVTECLLMDTAAF